MNVNSLLLASITACALVLSPGTAKAQAVKYQITGLFSAERVPDLHAVFEKIPQVKLVGVDFKNAEASFEFDVKKAFPNARPPELVQRLDGLVKAASNHTFGVKPLRTVPRDRLQWIEIPVAGLDCKACCLAAYEAIYQLDGVEQATASFRDRRVTALIDPARTDRGKVEAALKQRGVTLKSP